MMTKKPGTGRLNARPEVHTFFSTNALQTQTAPAAATFRKVPSQRLTNRYGDVTWRITLQPVSATARLMALELVGDVLVGISQTGYTPIDIDLSEWNARQYGVSRKHLTLRPSFNKLYVIDLGSTNGTYVNGLPIGRSWAYAIKSDDILTLGKLNLKLHVVKGPA